MTLRSPLHSLIGCDDATVPEVFRARAEASRDKGFLTFRDRAWSYGDAWWEIGRFAAFLGGLGLRPGRDRVACYLGNCPEFLWTWVGASVNRNVFVAIHRSHRGALLQDMLSRSGARLLVTDLAAADELNLGDTGIERVVFVGGTPGASVSGAESLEWPRDAWTGGADIAEQVPTDIASILFTSGTTGRSKAAMILHNQYCRGGNAVASAMGISETDCWHAWPPLSHIGGQLDIAMSAIIGGARIALIERFSASKFWCEVERSGATLFIGFSNLLEILLKQPQAPTDSANPLRAGLIGFVPPDRRDPFEKRFSVKLFDVYGMTEAEPIALPQGDERPPPGSCGKFNPDFEIAIVDDDDNRVAPGRIGEIIARERRAGVMFAGYEHDEEATRLSKRGGWFHTGDIGLVDSRGFVFFKDRKKQMIRRGGENISSWELEMIVERHPDIEECAAIGVQSGLGDEEVKLVVALKHKRALSPAALHEWCLLEMAKFMVPRYIEIVDSLPRMDTGKIEKERLRSLGRHVFDARRPDLQEMPDER